ELPAMSGLELIARIRENPGYARLPVVAISAVADPEAPQRAFRLGADAFFPKPFSPSAVRRKVEELIHATPRCESNSVEAIEIPPADAWGSPRAPSRRGGDTWGIPDPALAPYIGINRWLGPTACGHQPHPGPRPPRPARKTESGTDRTDPSSPCTVAGAGLDF